MLITNEKKKKEKLYLHEKRVTVVNGVPQLKSEHRVCVHSTTPLPDLIGRQPVLVEAIVPADPLDDLEFTAHQPVPRIEDHAHARVAWVMRTELPAAAFLFAMEVEFGSPHDGQGLALVFETEG